MNQGLNSSHAGKITAMELKREIRTRLNKKRPHSSAGLTAQLINLVLETNPKSIASYCPLPSEPDVAQFNAWAKTTGYELSFPKVVGKDLAFAQGPLVMGAFGILEPAGAAVELISVDLMIIPALAIDQRGFRLGKGKGFYDRVLATHRPKAIFAVIFDDEYVELLATEPHDQKVHGFVSPNNRASFS